MEEMSRTNGMKIYRGRGRSERLHLLQFGMIELLTQLVGFGGIGSRELALADTSKGKIEPGASEVGDAQLS